MIPIRAERSAAIILLLALPDEPCLRGKRRYRYTVPRDPRRPADVVKRDLAMAHVTVCWHELNEDISEIVSVRRNARLKIVREA